MSEPDRQVMEASRAGGHDGWGAVRDRVRALVRAEVAASRPTEDARPALELIVESSLRYTEKDGAPAVAVADEHGRPQTVSDDGTILASQIRRSLEALREQHPAMFAPPPEPEAASAPVEAAPAPPERDWLSLDAAPPPADTPPEAARRGPRLPFSGNNPLPAWSGRARRAWTDFAALHRPKLYAAREQWPHVAGRIGSRVRDGLRRMRPDRPWRAKPLALGAVAAVALLAVVAYAASRSDPAALADEEQPTQTGALAPGNGAEVLHGVPEVIDTATLSLEGHIVHLFGVEWAPGGGKPDEFAHYLAGREVTCAPVATTGTYRCEVDGKDLSKVVLYNGGGRATDQATAELKAAADHARQARVGVWSK